MHVFHIITGDALADILRDGLRCGTAGAMSQDTAVQAANAYLDAHRPPALAQAAVSRKDCLYMFACLEGKILDIASGRAYPPDDLPLAAGMALLAVTVNPYDTYISDLNAYDMFLQASRYNTPEPARQQLAAAYWQSVRHWPAIAPHYRLAGNGITRRPAAPPTLPQAIKRLGLLVAADVPPQHIHIYRTAGRT